MLQIQSKLTTIQLFKIVHQIHNILTINPVSIAHNTLMFIHLDVLIVVPSITQQLNYVNNLNQDIQILITLIGLLQIYRKLLRKETKGLKSQELLSVNSVLLIMMDSPVLLVIMDNSLIMIHTDVKHAKAH